VHPFRRSKTGDADASTKCRRIFGLRRLRVPDTEDGRGEDGQAAGRLPERFNDHEGGKWVVWWVYTGE